MYFLSDIQHYFEYILKIHRKNTDDLLIKVYVNKVVKRITFKELHYHELLTPETMKLLRSTRNNVIKNKNGENIPHLEIREILLTIITNKIQKFGIHLFQINHLVIY